MMAKQSLSQQVLLDFVAMRLSEKDHQQVLAHLAEHEADLLRVEALWESDDSAVPEPPVNLKKQILEQTLRAKYC